MTWLDQIQYLVRMHSTAEARGTTNERRGRVFDVENAIRECWPDGEWFFIHDVRAELERTGIMFSINELKGCLTQLCHKDIGILEKGELDAKLRVVPFRVIQP